MKICIHASTRPNIIKQYSLIKGCQKKNIDYYILHTGQHYSRNMSENFFEEFNIPNQGDERYINLGIVAPDRGVRISKILMECNRLFTSPETRPDMVIVQGDTDSDYVVGLSARLNGIILVHNEAGIRSNDNIPEEFNRRMLDQISDYLLIPTETDYKRIQKENIMGKKILTGNTVCDCIKEHIPDLTNTTEKYILFTCHRNNNTDDKNELRRILYQVREFAKKHEAKVIFPIHPRTAKKIEEYGIQDLLQTFDVIAPTGYKQMLEYIAYADIIITDSGGIQEECCVLRKQCIIIRDSSERIYNGSILWKGDIDLAYVYLPDKSKIFNIFNPHGWENIGIKILDRLIKDLLLNKKAYGLQGRI